MTHALAVIVMIALVAVSLQTTVARGASSMNFGATVASYTYDGHQHLAKKLSADGGTTHYLYGKNGRLYGEYATTYSGDTPIIQQKEYAFLGNKLVGQSLSLLVSPAPGGCGFNADRVGAIGGTDATSDGLVITRYHRGLAGSALISGTRLDQTPANQPITTAAINAFMDSYHAAHDMDGNGSVELKDALIITRYLAGFRGPALTSGLTLSGTRTNAADIEAYIAQGCPGSANTDTLTYLHPNVSGSPIMATDGYGNPAWREDYLAFGEKTKYEASQNSNTNSFIGKPTDATTGLVYFGARWYDPTIGRFLSVDLAAVDDANPHSFNRYAYGNNNPNKFLDPDGRVVFLIPLIAAAVEAAPAIAAVSAAGYAAARAAPGVQRAVAAAMSTVNSLAANPATVSALETMAGIFSGTPGATSVAMSSASAATQVGRTLFHYTDEVGARAIQQTGMILADARGRVFLTAEKLTPKEVANTLFLGKSGMKGSHVVEVRVKEGVQILEGKNGKELIHQGTIRDGRQADIGVRPNE